MDNEKNVNMNSSEGGEQPKKKKWSVVFHAQNSQQNSLKMRPQTPGAPKKPAGTSSAARPASGTSAAGKTPAGTSAAAKTPARPAAASGTVAPAAKKPAAPAPEKPAEKAAEKPVKAAPAAETAAEVKKPAEEAVKPAKTAAKTAEKTAEAAETKPAAKPAEAAETVPAEPAKAAGKETSAEKPARKTTKKAETAAAEVKAPETKAPEAEAPKVEEPPKPVRRFVDMSKVRQAEQEAKDRTERLAREQKERREAAKSGTGTRPEGRRPAGPGQGTQGRFGQTGRGAYTQNANGETRAYHSGGTGTYQRTGNTYSQRTGATGSQGFMKDKDDDQRPRRPAGAGAGKPAGSRSGGADFGGLGLSKNGKNTKQTRTQQGSSKTANSRYNKGDSGELRRPGGKTAKGKGIKDLDRLAKEQKAEPKEPQIKTIAIPEKLTLKELADAMKMQPAAIIKKLFLEGKVFTVNQDLDYDTAADIALDFDIVAEKEETVDVIAELLKDTVEDKEENMVPRPPVVCVMGHVDHGKTSLMDAIRKANVATGEAGGITQHIGAYMVEINGRKITFLDTPGHEAFTAMRMRGAQATDIAILVVAADDGVMPQTVEAINHAKAAGVEIVVAINKIDKPGANIDKVKKELSEYGLIGEEWGGSNVFVPVSAKRGDGIEDLLEMVLLVADVQELKADPKRAARGLVIEAQLDPTRGPVATVLVQKGTLHVGDNVAAGGCYGKIRAMLNDKGERVKEATPGMPVELLGLSSVPGAGEVFISTKAEKDARAYAETFIAEGRKKLLEETRSKLSLDDLFNQIQSGNMKELNLIVKADVQGSVEAVKTSLQKLSNEQVAVKVIHSAAGNISESDVTLASASNAIIIGFNVKPDAQARSVAEQEKVDIRLYDVIYKAIEDVEAAMLGMLEPEYEEQIIGHAVVRQVFKASGIGNIAGCFVLDGKLQRGCKCRITRGKDQLFDGNLASLKRFKDDVKEVAAGYECGLVFEKFGDFDVDDTIEAYAMVELPRKLPSHKD